MARVSKNRRAARRNFETRALKNRARKSVRRLKIILIFSPTRVASLSEKDAATLAPDAMIDDAMRGIVSEVADAQFGIGMMCERGDGLLRDDAQAFSWYQKAAQQGHAEAMTSVGWMYKKGQGVSQNYEKAVIWMRKSAERGSHDAMALLGTMYKNGQGVKQNYAQAAGWYQKASDQGEVAAKFQLLDILADCKNNPDINGCSEVNKSY